MNKRQTKDPRTELIRVFCALPLSSATVSALQAGLRPIQRQLAGARWTHPTRWHITLRFYGNVTTALAQRLANALDALTIPMMPVTLRGVGGFPNSQRARVVWLGIDDPSRQLHALHTQVETLSSALGCPLDERPYRPHLTIARCPKNRELQIPESMLAEASPALDTVLDRVVLYQSSPQADGPRYTPIVPGKPITP